VVDNACK